MKVTLSSKEGLGGEISCVDPPHQGTWLVLYDCQCGRPNFALTTNFFIVVVEQTSACRVGRGTLLLMSSQPFLAHQAGQCLVRENV